MTYEEMRALFARLSETEGRFTVYLAYGETRAGRSGVSVAWTVVVRDDGRPLLPGSDIHALYRLTTAADLARLEVGDRPDGLSGLEEADADGGEGRGAPAHQLTWRDVLGVLDQLEARAPGWAVERIAGTLARASRYCLTVRAATGATHPLPSRDAVDRLCLAEGPLGAHPGGRSGAADTHHPGPHMSGRPASAIAAWALCPMRWPLPRTPGNLALDTAAGDTYLWVDLCAPTADNLRIVARALCLPYDTMLATLSAGSWPHVVRRSAYTALRLPMTRVAPLDAAIVVEAFDLIVGRNALVTIHRRPLPALQRVRAQDALSRIATASSLAGLILAEALASEEALARWMAREADAWIARAPTVPDPRGCLPGALHCKHSAAAIRRAADGRRGALAIATAPGHDASESPPIPATEYLMAREARLVASLRVAERDAGRAVRLLAVRATWRERARRVGLMRLAGVLGATALAGLVRLALVGAHLAAPVLGAATLVCFLIAGLGGVIADRVGNGIHDRADGQTRAAWEDADEDGESG